MATTTSCVSFGITVAGKHGTHGISAKAPFARPLRSRLSSRSSQSARIQPHPFLLPLTVCAFTARDLTPLTGHGFVVLIGTGPLWPLSRAATDTKCSSQPIGPHNVQRQSAFGQRAFSHFGKLFELTEFAHRVARFERVNATPNVLCFPPLSPVHFTLCLRVCG